MTKTRQVYRCPICGNVVEVLHSGAVLSCCGQPMQLMEENATDGAYEKHVPVIEPIEGGYRVKVGSVALLGVIYAAATQGPMLEYAVICAIGALISMVGDLAASAIKRNPRLYS